VGEKRTQRGEAVDERNWTGKSLMFDTGCILQKMTEKRAGGYKAGRVADVHAKGVVSKRQG